MADRNINLSIRKPRRIKGTPSYRQRNIVAFGVLFLSASCWTLYEFWSQTRKLKKSIIEGKFEYSQEVKERLVELQLGFDSDLVSVLEHKRQKKYAETPRRQSWFSKLLASSPDL